MNRDPKTLINGHLDDCLSADDRAMLNKWLRESPVHVDQFARAVLLHNRIRVEYLSFQAILGQVDGVRPAGALQWRIARRWRMALAAAACLALAAGVYLSMGARGNPRADAISEFHQMVVLGRAPADRTYRVTFVKDTSDEPEDLSNMQPARKPEPPGPHNVAMLYIRDGRQFVYAWQALDGRHFVIGGNGQVSWAVRPDVPPQVMDPMHFTGGLPAGMYLAPLLSFFDGQEKMLSSHYNLEMRPRDKATRLFVAMKKPDTKQGPRRIEIAFAHTTGRISEMRIWPATSDHRRTNHTLIELVGEQELAPEFFSHVFHQNPGRASKPDAPG